MGSAARVCFQFAFAFDGIKALSAQHPEMKETQPFKAVLDGNHAASSAAGEKGLRNWARVANAVSSSGSLLACRM